MNTNTNTNTQREHQIDVIDHPHVAMWMKDTAKKDPEGFLRLVGNNVKDLQKIYGTADWTNDGKKGWTHGWSIYENGMQWVVLTGMNGTLFRIRLPVAGESYLSDTKIGVGIIQYLSTLLKLLAN